ncbi:MAG: hypothetical protein ACI8Z1_000584 [Candidatus Azotimanducaceae bacterium]|jgi:hypothetical protein
MPETKSAYLSGYKVPGTFFKAGLAVPVDTVWCAVAVKSHKTGQIILRIFSRIIGFTALIRSQLTEWDRDCEPTLWLCFEPINVHLHLLYLNGVCGSKAAASQRSTR